MKLSNTSFWDFSVRLYAKPGVATACLELQDENHMDVNLLLYCFWYSRHYGVVSTQLLERVHGFSVEWRLGVVEPLRSSRVWLKNRNEISTDLEEAQLASALTVKERIKAIELEAEKVQQQQMQSLTEAENLLHQNSISVTELEQNLELLLQLLDLSGSESVWKQLNTIKASL